MPDLISFLRTRLAADAAFAAGWRLGGEEYAETGFPVDPARVLADVAAKRRIIDRCMPIVAMSGWEYSDAPDLAWGVLHGLAQPYADHPDFQAEWRSA